MHVITARISDEVNNLLSELAQEIVRPKGYIIRKAIEEYLENKSDLLLALARIENSEDSIDLEEVKKKYGLED